MGSIEGPKPDICDKPFKIHDDTCDSLHSLKRNFLEKGKSYPRVYEDKKDGNTYYDIGGELGPVSESALTCFLAQNPDVEFTPLGLADTFKNNPDYINKSTGNYISKDFRDFGGNKGDEQCNVPMS